MERPGDGVTSTVTPGLTTMAEEFVRVPREVTLVEVWLDPGYTPPWPGATPPQDVTAAEVIAGHDQPATGDT